MESFCSDNIKDLATAMLKVQAELNPAVKDASNPFARSRYASLNSVITASREALLNNGIWVVQYPVPVESGHLGLVTRITHAESGQWQSSLMVMPLAKSDPQGFGSAMTYARRYSISAMIGLIVEDDDAESACIRPKNGFTNGNAGTNNSTGTNGSNGSTGSNGSNGSTAGANESNGTNGSNHQPISHQQVTPQDAASGLPILQGISYQAVPSEDGRLCIVAMGNTIVHKDYLKNSGFRWNPDRKTWWRFIDSA
jgi:hypothetical protein